MAAGVTVAGILTLAVLTMAIQHQAFAQANNQGSSYDNSVARNNNHSIARKNNNHSIATMTTTNNQVKRLQ
jgi:hypothetical protein